MAGLLDFLGFLDGGTCDGRPVAGLTDSVEAEKEILLYLGRREGRLFKWAGAGVELDGSWLAGR